MNKRQKKYRPVRAAEICRKSMKKTLGNWFFNMLLGTNTRKRK